MVQLRQGLASSDAVVDRDPFAVGEKVAVLPWSFPAWDFDWGAFHRRVVFPALEDLLCQVELPEDPVVVLVVDLVEVAAAAAAFLVVEMDRPVVPDRDSQVESDIAEVFRRNAALEFEMLVAY